MPARYWKSAAAGRVLAGRLSAAPILASAAGILDNGTPHPFTLQLVLDDPAPLYAGYRRRKWLTAGLILSSLAAAMGGLAGLWRNSRRQAVLSDMKRISFRACRTNCARPSPPCD